MQSNNVQFYLQSNSHLQSRHFDELTALRNQLTAIRSDLKPHEDHTIQQDFHNGDK